MVIRRSGAGRSVSAIAAACLIALGAPTPAGARVTVSVELVFGSVAVGGAGVFVALSGSWEAFAKAGGVPDALVELAGSRVRFGMPLAPLQALPGDDPGYRPAADGLLLNLVRWRF